MSNPNWNSLIERGESSKTLVRFEEVTDEDIPRLRYEVSLPGSYKGHAFLEIEADGLPWKESAYEINRLPGQFTVEIPNAPTKVRVKAPAAPDPVPNQVHVRAPAAAGDKSPAIINNDGDGFYASETMKYLLVKFRLRLWKIEHLLFINHLGITFIIFTFQLQSQKTWLIQGL